MAHPPSARPRNLCAWLQAMRPRGAAWSADRCGQRTCTAAGVYAFFAVTVDALHALLMVLWVGGLPLLFWHRWPRLTTWYGSFAIAFIVLNQASRFFLGECFLTTIARAFWDRARFTRPAHVDEWFTVRFATLVFHMTPTHRSIAVVSEALIFVTAMGALYSIRRLRARARGGFIR